MTKTAFDAEVDRILSVCPDDPGRANEEFDYLCWGTLRDKGYGVDRFFEGLERLRARTPCTTKCSTKGPREQPREIPPFTEEDCEAFIQAVRRAQGI